MDNMRRKSERNKPKGSPEKKVDKPTRKSSRRRGKRSTSSSPERDDSQEDATSDASLSRESSKESTRLQTKELKPIPEKDETVVLTEGVVDKDASPETEDNGSVWKVARADASPGEIQKLKLCRQRNMSETSDNSTSRKRSHKWQGSGEGVVEEVDSNDERLGSPRVEPGGMRPDDTSSIPPGQDSNEEVSDYKETLPESTSANLSDAKPNIDLQGDSNEASCSNQSNDIKSNPIDTSADLISYGDQAAQAVSRLQEIMTEQGNEAYSQEYQQNTSDATFTEKDEQVPGRGEEGEQYPEEDQGTPKRKEDLERKGDCSVIEKKVPQGDKKIQQVEGQDCQEYVPEIEEQASRDGIPVTEEQVSSEGLVLSKADSPQKGEESSQDGEDLEKRKSSQVAEESPEVPRKKKEQVPAREEDTHENSRDTPQKGEDTPQRDDRKDSSSDDERVGNKNDHSDSNSNGESRAKVRSSLRASSRSTRRKHRSKYRESSNSDTPDSEDDPSTGRESKQSATPEAEVPREKEYLKDRSRSKSLEPRENSPVLNSRQTANEVEDVEKEDTKIVDSTSGNKSIASLSNASTSSQKPAKINLKRTFTRLSVDEHKTEDTSLSTNTDSIQTKENHTDDKTEQKRVVPKRRRWGTTLSTDTTTDFSISTDSLKALVPGAKPLSITEVRLSKDDEDEHISGKDREKKHHTSDSNGEYTVREETIAQKMEGPRKGDSKADNHIGSRRKISVVRDIPHTKAPNSPPSKGTSILLIKNLVRPFTLTQIKELLSRTGTIVEGGFWMDRIKSKCFVEYSNEDQAFETRQALHGISWPTSNPKKLQVEYASKEDMQLARDTCTDQPVSRKAEPHLQSDSWQRDWARDDKNQVGGTKVMVVREWDLGKEDGQLHVVKEERDKKEFEKKKRHRSQTPPKEVHLPAPARKFKKKEDDPPPAKLLDDLFRKTKATPCIYWLPLTNEQIVVKEEMRRQHMAEHARRLEEMRRAERNRESRRRRSPRK
ncbi:apoptotic chromatin condensation inducer in the nucleus isoform X2 [Belonocnema kinseyi]|uniref:apoptotic chromatin condensation inducer in the nucleus isoform X2 n=1 Tax=Belonocnema kinseyi TaxID=2817044 RepID=UPI00143DACA6|nr:apoptotic chromatin condensation inducer in the nucleus isoform X2 [Belonocnema kinseyi]